MPPAASRSIRRFLCFLHSAARKALSSGTRRGGLLLGEPPNTGEEPIQRKGHGNGRKQMDKLRHRHGGGCPSKTASPHPPPPKKGPPAPTPENVSCRSLNYYACSLRTGGEYYSRASISGTPLIVSLPTVPLMEVLIYPGSATLKIGHRTVTRDST